MTDINRLGLGTMGMRFSNKETSIKTINRERYFLSVKFGVLPQPGGGIYGLDNNPFHVKAHLAYFGVVFSEI